MTALPNPDDEVAKYLHDALEDHKAYSRAGRGVMWRPLPHQIPPTSNWRGWGIVAGRGSGKTAACARFVNEHAVGPACIPGSMPHNIGIVAPTLGDAATSCYRGASGILSFNPQVSLRTVQGGTFVFWPNGAEAKMFGAREPDDVERLRAGSGGGFCLVWFEELAAMRYMKEAWDQARFGLRLGDHPRWIVSTTPKPRTLIKKLVKGEVKNSIVTHATTDDNPHLAPDVREELYEAYEGTVEGAQELRGVVVDEDPNALFTREKLEEQRVTTDEVPKLNKIEVGVDPSGGSGEQGIVVVGGHREYVKGSVVKSGYVLADYSGIFSPEGWGRRSLDAAVEYEADCIVVETNFGGDMAVATIYAAAEKMGLHIPVRTVHASRGKQPRAQPISAMCSQDRWHMVGIFELLEDQLCTWTTDSDNSPDRMDAMVWPAWHMKLVSKILHTVGSFGGGQMSRRRISA